MYIYLIKKVIYSTSFHKSIPTFIYCWIFILPLLLYIPISKIQNIFTSLKSKSTAMFIVHSVHSILLLIPPPSLRSPPPFNIFVGCIKNKTSCTLDYTLVFYKVTYHHPLHIPKPRVVRFERLYSIF